jgi:putative membrane protein
LQTIIPQLLFMGALSSLAVFTHGRIFGEKIPLNPAPFTLFGVALALFLGFRNSASYARFIEGRLLWGNLLISTRTLTSQVRCYLHENIDEAERVRLAYALIALVYALKHQLRRTDPMPDLRRLLGDERADALRGKFYKPVAILNDIRGALAAIHGCRPPDTASWMFDAQINDMEKTVGGCERIASTPIPFAYSVLLHRTVYAYCILLPFGLVDSTVSFTPMICVVISYTLIALEAIANEVAEPFGLAPNALALDAMTRTIERSILEMCGLEIPEELAPVDLYRLT